ncbi:BCCT family transporter [Pararhodobacter oceanensis]|uniref:BCCT family transporter n=1 Tax=Pararhodobacter oceanensis TaxID=2172121 RepID=UPI003A903BEC
MSKKPPLLHLPIPTHDKGFYNGFSRAVTMTSTMIIAIVVIWAVAYPEEAGRVLAAINGYILSSFATWYIYVMGAFVVVCGILALWPASGRLKLGLAGDTPEFSSFSWYSMMFGAGIGVGMLTWAVAEPSYNFNNNPDVLLGLASSGGADNITNAFKWSFLHWGISAWATYAVAGLCLAYFTYRRGLPMTMRSSLVSLFGRHLSGPLGHAIDVFAVVATVFGVAQALGFGVNQLVDGLSRIGLGGYLTLADGTPSAAGIIVAIVLIMGASTLSAVSGVGRGIKWLSNINMVLSFFVLAFLLVFGATTFGLTSLFQGLWVYILDLPVLLFTVYEGGTETGDALVGWQGGWTVFYWAWWIAFAPFVGLFLARISKGRTVREFVIGVVAVPSLIACVWFSLAGGTAMHLEMTGEAAGAISGATDGGKIFAMMDVLIPSAFLSWLMAALIVVLLMTYLVTSADSAVLVVNTINAGGYEGPKARPHIIFWGVAVGGVVAALLLIGGIGAIQTAMVIGALPFSVVMALMCVSLLKAVFNDTRRMANGVPSTVMPAEQAAE